jgi:hypothetical protein
LLIEETNTFCTVNKKISDEVKTQIKSWRKKWEYTCQILLNGINEIPSTGHLMDGYRDIGGSRGVGTDNLFVAGEGEGGGLLGGGVFYETVGGFRDEERGVHRRVRSLTPAEYRGQMKQGLGGDGGDVIGERKSHDPSWVGMGERRFQGLAGSLKEF